jgi:hypothetical protein
VLVKRGAAVFRSSLERRERSEVVCIDVRPYFWGQTRDRETGWGGGVISVVKFEERVK